MPAFHVRLTVEYVKGEGVEQLDWGTARCKENTTAPIPEPIGKRYLFTFLPTIHALKTMTQRESYDLRKRTETIVHAELRAVLR